MGNKRKEIVVCRIEFIRPIRQHHEAHRCSNRDYPQGCKDTLHAEGADIGRYNILKTQRRGNIRYLPFVTTLESIRDDNTILI